ncbi:GAF domain-containing protein [Pedobacter sp. MC2016-14]|uniref:GAF domain-containing protein n=1 Tax=Pedobacter sp. MC2016-14 TaxID=2897327 RepID=UPI001E65A340|nr:GAF domain-containing protein [Pedobacter sp. MC2016-14]MCD0488672.1 GAF domain-containing protein [Pedobacter sp. MC2016-14]
MQAITLDLNPEGVVAGTKPAMLEAKFSLKPFMDFVAEKVKTERTAKVNFYKYILDRFHQYPELEGPILAGDAPRYSALFELIYTALSPILNDEEEQLWALSTPLSPCIYFGSDAFYQVLLDPVTGSLKSGLQMPSESKIKESTLLNFYDIVLKKFYNISFRTALFDIKSIIDPDTHLLKHYNLDVDTRFLEIKNLKELPVLSLETFKDDLQDERSALQILQHLLPLEDFSIEGISVITLTDVTREYALESIKNIIIEHHECNVGCHSDHLSVALKTLVGSDEIEFGLLPYVQINGKMITHDHSGFTSIVIDLAKKEKLDYEQLLEDYVLNPRRLIFPDITSEEENLKYPLLKILSKNGIKAYALVPLYYNGKLVGCLEMYSKNQHIFTSQTLSKAEPATTLLAQLFQNIITDFNYDIITVLTDKFTSIQSSVRWRFYEAAYRYIGSGARERNLPVESIYFEDVHPFYGAVDIRNSSLERNLVIRKDLYTHFEILEKTLEGIKDNIELSLEEQIPAHSKIWGYKDFEELSDREILKIEDYLQRQLPLYLNLLKTAHPEVAQLVTEYFERTAAGSEIYKNRSEYELSMQMINRAVNAQLDEFNTELQAIYPLYFEKFRTDGVEFDMYLGQSIAPQQPMPADLLSRFRLMQLQRIANITKATHELMPELPLKLSTTQLIFVYEKVIDISFRTDEQRFDVEGSYNIRYQMVKKRIDKVHILHSQERLTQVGKIAIVYFNHWEAREYMGYIETLQQQGLLEEHVEHLDLEELQGVEGLKALRVKVVI